MARCKLLLPIVLCLLAGIAEAQLGGDLQAQILYAFHSEDANQLDTLVQTMRTQVQSGSADEALHYHLAHAEYRVGALADARHAHAAEAAFAACVEQLKPLSEKDGYAAEALILESACYSGLARLKRIEAVLLRSHAAERLRAAAKLAPRNPRVVYLQALEDMGSAKPKSAQAIKAYEELQHAVQIFQLSSATSAEVPGWGDAEAYLDFGRQLQGRGDVVGARNWIEQSLIVAPNYKAAQKQLANLIGR